MHAIIAAGAGFLIAVLWFDLMFDVQIRRSGGATAAPEVLASISAYYRRVTTEAAPMSRLIAAVMLTVLAAIVVEIVAGGRWIAWISLAAALGPITLARVRTVPSAVRLGRGDDPPDVQSQLARTVLLDHLICLAGILLLLTLQLAAALT